jgi:hypothetical protein
VIHGKMIELAEESGFPDGQEVTVSLRPVEPSETPWPPGEGLRRAFGGWAEDAEELDQFLEWNRQQRKIDRPEIERSTQMATKKGAKT